MPHSQRNRLLRLRWLPLVFALLLLVVNTWRAPLYGFNDDDLMNLYKAWVQPGAELFRELALFWTTQSRPAGGLWYLAIYKIAGMNPLWYHLSLWLMNLGGVAVLFALFRRLTPQLSLYGPALALAAFQPTLWDNYVTTGMVYDVLVSLFIWGAMLVALRHRQWGTPFTWQAHAAILALHWAAIQSKELGIALPAILVAYELLLRKPNQRQWGYIVGPAILSLAYALGRGFVGGGLNQNEAYQAEFTLSRILENAAGYTSYIPVDIHRLSLPWAGAIWALWLGVALWLRSRMALFGLAWFWLALLPMLVAPFRYSGYPLYLGMPGLALSISALIWSACKALRTTRRLRLVANYGACLALTLALIFCGRAMNRFYRPTKFYAHLGRCARDLKLPLHSGSIIMVVDSPVEFEWIPLFLFGLHYNIKDLMVRQCTATQMLENTCPLPPPYDHLIVWSKVTNRFEILKGEELAGLQDPRKASKANANSPLASYFLRKGFGDLESLAWRWAGAETQVHLGNPNAKTLVLDLVHAGVVERTQGPLQLVAEGDMQPQHFTLPKEGRQTMRLPFQAATTQALVNLRVRVLNPPPDPARSYIFYAASLE